MSLKECALFYASIGLPVFPLYPEKKTPAISGGFHKATTDLDTVNQWWSNTPRSNIGVATGDGLVCIDLDCKRKGENGSETLREWEEDNGKLPDTWECITPTGSIHRYYGYDTFQEVIGTINHGEIFPDIDIHGDGSYMVMAPSIVLCENGLVQPYMWEASSSPEDISLAKADDIVLKFIHEAFSSLDDDDGEKFIFPEKISQGRRNRTLFRASASMQAKGFCDEAIRLAIEAENKNRCIPPLSDKEVEGIINSVLKRYPKGGGQAWKKQQLDLLNQEAELLKRKRDLLNSQR